MFLRSKLRISTAKGKETSAYYNTLPSRAPAPFYTAPKRRASGHRAMVGGTRPQSCAFQPKINHIQLFALVATRPKNTGE